MKLPISSFKLYNSGFLTFLTQRSPWYSFCNNGKAAFLLTETRIVKIPNQPTKIGFVITEMSRTVCFLINLVVMGRIIKGIFSSHLDFLAF